MSMSQLPTVDDLLNIANGGQAKTFWEAWLDFTAQSMGGAAETTVTIAGGVIAVSQCLNAVDTEGAAAADDLTNIDTTGIPNGSVIVLSCLRADHVPTVKHGVAGAGRILLADAADYALNSTSKHVMLYLRGTDWVEMGRAIAADLGTAAKKNTGTANGNIPLLGSQGLPAVSGELLTDIPRIGNFAPSQQPSPNMTLAIGAGSILIGTALTKVAAQNTATITAPAANSRNDIVYIDATTGAVGVAAGAENVAPVDPAVPAGKLPVARLRLATTTTSIKSAIIDDIRQQVGSATQQGLSDSHLMQNAQLNVTVAGNAITVALKTQAGADPSAADPVKVAFRKSPVTDGGYVVRSITAALSMTVSAGSTLGFAASEANALHIGFIDNAGTVELAVSKDGGLWQEDKLVTTTAEGGAGAADSATVLYSATARANVACRMLGMCAIATGATAGNWSNAPTKLILTAASPMSPLKTATKAYVSFTTVTTTSIRDSVNVASLTDNGTGDTTINFLTPLADPAYVCSFLSVGLTFISATGSPSASSIRVCTVTSGGVFTDYAWNMFTATGGNI